MFLNRRGNTLLIQEVSFLYSREPRCYPVSDLLTERVKLSVILWHVFLGPRASRFGKGHVQTRTTHAPVEYRNTNMIHVSGTCTTAFTSTPTHTYTSLFTLARHQRASSRLCTVHAYSCYRSVTRNVQKHWSNGCNN